jgi:hypothetical protein
VSKYQFVALNIETEPDLSYEDRLPEPDVKFGRTTDPEKRQAKLEAKKAEQRGKMALDPHFAKVLCVGFVFRNTEQVIVSPTIIARGELTEADVLKWFWRQLAACGHIVTFNGIGFDLPFLIRRSLLTGTEIQRELIHESWLSKYRCMSVTPANQPAVSHTDLMQLLHQTEGLYEPALGYSRTLRFYAEHLLGKEFPFADVDQSQLGTCDALIVQQLCRWNTIATLEIFEKVRNFYP